MSPSTRECRCVSCSECKGTGQVTVPTDGYPEWDLETCPACHGSGLSEVCSSCQEQGYYDDDAA